MGNITLGLSAANMEAKLAHYRAKKAMEQRQSLSIVETVIGLFRKSGNRFADKAQDRSGIDSPHTKHLDQQTDMTGELQGVENEQSLPDSPRKYRRLLLVLKFVLWLMMWGIFIELQFGAVFFTMSSLLFVYMNTRTGRDSNKKSLSAYSVFNPNCERLQGTITAEQFEAELLHRKPLDKS